MAFAPLCADKVLKPCERIVEMLDKLLDVSVKMLKTVEIRRTPPIADNVKDHNYNIEGIVNSYEVLKKLLKDSIRVYIGTIKTVRRFMKDINEACPYELDVHTHFIDPNDILAIKLFWEEVGGGMQETKCRLLNLVKHIYLLELERSEFFASTLMFVLTHEEHMDTVRHDIHYLAEFWRLYELWSPWLVCVPLIMEFEATSLPMDVFLDITDGIHINYFDIFVSMGEDPDISEEYHNISFLVRERGFTGPPYLVDQDAETINQYISRKTQAHRMALKLKYNFSQHFPDDVYQRIITKALRKIAPIINSVYNEVRRSLVSVLRWFYGENALKEKMAIVLRTELGLKFYKCNEILQRLRLLAKRALSTMDNQVVFYEKMVNEHLTDVMNETRGFPEAFFEQRNTVLREMIISEYNNLKTYVTLAVTRFMVHASEVLCQTGYLFLELPERIRLDFTNIVVSMRELLRLADRSIKESSGVSMELVSVEWFNVAPYEFGDSLRHLIRSLQQFSYIAQSGRILQMEDFFRSIPLTKKIRSVALEMFQIPTENGLIAPKRELSTTVKIEVKYLNGEPTNPLEDSFMNDKAFRQILSGLMNSEIEPNAPGVVFE